MINNLRQNLKLRPANIERYLPDVIAKAKEYKAYSVEVDQELNVVIKAMLIHMLNTFVYDIDESGARRWEKMLRLNSNGENLETRRAKILQKINQTLPYTERRLQQMLNAVYGDGKTAIELYLNKYALDCELVGIAYKAIEVREFLWEIIPANLCILMTSQISTDYLLYSGGVAMQNKEYSIYPNKDFAISGNTILNTGAAGVYSSRKIISIRS